MIRYFADPKDTRPGTAQSAESVRNTPLSTMRGMGGAGVKLRWGDNMIIQGGGGSGRGGGGGASLRMVAALPAIPDNGTDSVVWGTSTQITGGTGDGQIWDVVAGQSRWTPRQNYTTLSGVPV